MEHVRIFQGNQIGGCVTVISAVHDGEIHRIMIDYGSSLPGADEKEVFQYPWKEEPVDAVFFTHYHGDHVGRITEIPKEIPLYMGTVARQVMINVYEALAKVEKSGEYKKVLDVLHDDNRIKTFYLNERNYYDHVTNIPGFKIEPYTVDHSAYDAYMFLIETEGPECDNGKKVILHTGDFRGHGRRGKALLHVIKSYVHKNGRKVNTLVIEGTMISRNKEKVRTETEMMYEAADYLKQHKYAFLICSSTNLDSLASFYQAAQKAARPYKRYLYVYNNYLKIQLKTFSDTAGGLSDVYKFENVHKLGLNDEFSHQYWDKPKTQKQIMEEKGFLAIIKAEDWCEKYVNPFVEDYKAGKIDQMPVIIYSMWDGYLMDYFKDENGNLVENKAKIQSWVDFLSKMEDNGVEVNHLHTSGHASTQMIADVIKAVAPTDEIYPMHTERPKMFEKLEIGECTRLIRYE